MGNIRCGQKPSMNDFKGTVAAGRGRGHIPPAPAEGGERGVVFFNTK